MGTKKILTSICLFISSVSFSQSIPFEPSYFEDKKNELKSVLVSLQSGTEFYHQGRKEFEDFKRQYLMKNHYYPVSLYDYENNGNVFFRRAAGLLNNANRFNPNNADVNYMLGFIYLCTDPNNPETLKYLEKAAKLSDESDTDLNYWLAWCYQLNSNWDEAMKYYGIHSQILHQKPKISVPVLDDLKKKMDECLVGKKLCENPERVFVENLGPNINTEFPEYGASITTDESSIFFTSRRPGSVGGRKDESDGQFYEDVYYANRLKNKWQKPLQLGKSVNTDGHDAIAGLSPDGNRLYVYRYSAMDGGDVYESKLEGDTWEEPLLLNKYINTKYHESSVSISYDGKHLFL